MNSVQSNIWMLPSFSRTDENDSPVMNEWVEISTIHVHQYCDEKMRIYQFPASQFPPLHPHHLQPRHPINIIINVVHYWSTNQAKFPLLRFSTLVAMIF